MDIELEYSLIQTDKFMRSFGTLASHKGYRKPDHERVTNMLNSIEYHRVQLEKKKEELLEKYCDRDERGTRKLVKNDQGQDMYAMDKEKEAQFNVEFSQFMHTKFKMPVGKISFGDVLGVLTPFETLILEPLIWGLELKPIGEIEDGSKKEA